MKSDKFRENKKPGQPRPLPAGTERTQIMTLREVAEYLGLHYLTIYRLIREGKIPAARLGGRWRFKRDVLDRWIENDMESRMPNRKRRAA